jgi:hypothetical protein
MSCSTQTSCEPTAREVAAASPTRIAGTSLDELTYGRERTLKDRIAHWREALGAAAI